MFPIFVGVVLAIGSSAMIRAQTPQAPVHNIVFFIPDGLRSSIVDRTTAPTLAAVAADGVTFTDSHSLFPTFTTPNASAFATGHYLGDTGDFSNTVYTGFAVPGAGDSVTPFLESDAVLGDVDEHFAGDYLDEETVLAAARGVGYSTAAIGKLGPVLIQDHTERTGRKTIVIDDSTGSATGIPLSPEMTAALKAARLPIVAPSRGDNGLAGTATTRGTLSANIIQQDFFVDVTTKVVLPLFRQRGKPFVLVFWSRDPDGSQHNEGDSLGKLVPGINGPTSLAAIRNADGDLKRLEAALEALDLAATTDIVVAADHGFSTISKQSKTSPSTRFSYPDVPSGLLPPGFVAVDLAEALREPLIDPDKKYQLVDPKTGQHPSRGNELVGGDKMSPDVVVAANGGSDLVYLPQTNARALAPRIVAFLQSQDYVSGIFVDDALGSIPGTLPLSAINLKGSALTPYPAIVVNFTSMSTGCDVAARCTAEVADTSLQQGQGMHGSFNRADTQNFIAAIGPDFKTHYVDDLPASNADIGKTLASLLKLDIPANGKLIGRVLTETMPDSPIPTVTHQTIRSRGLHVPTTILNVQDVGATRYFDAAGFAGRTVGLNATSR